MSDPRWPQERPKTPLDRLRSPKTTQQRLKLPKETSPDRPQAAQEAPRAAPGPSETIIFVPPLAVRAKSDLRGPNCPRHLRIRGQINYRQVPARDSRSANNFPRHLAICHHPLRCPIGAGGMRPQALKIIRRPQRSREASCKSVFSKSLAEAFVK